MNITGDPLILKAHESHINTIKFSLDGRILLSAGMDNLVKFWSVPDWKHTGTLSGHEKSVNVLKNGKLNVVLKSLKKSEREKVDVMCNTAIKDSDILVHTQGGLDRYRSKRLLAMSIVEVDKERIAGFEAAMRYLESTSDWVYEHLISTFNLYVLAVGDALTEEKIKNV